MNIEKDIATEASDSIRKLGEKIITNTPRPGEAPGARKRTNELPDRPVESILSERETTHGSFEQNAKISQHLKSVFHFYAAEDMHMIHRESLDMFALKISRILSGQADYAEHWDDLAGYAKLASKACTK